MEASDRNRADRQKPDSRLEFTRKDIARVADNPEFSKFGAMRRWKEVVKLVFVPGKLDQRQEHGFAVMNPIYGYTDAGQE